MRSLKLLCAAPLLLAACSAEVDENVGTADSALMGSPTAKYAWEENATMAEMDLRQGGRQVGIAEELVDRADIDESVFKMKPKFIILSGPAPLTPATDEPCSYCKR